MLELHLYTILKNVLVTTIAENIETKTPIAKTKANPRTAPVPNWYKTKLVKRVDAFESRMEVQALEKPSSIATSLRLPMRISSFILSKIKILASTAIPIDKIKPAIPERVRVIPYGVRALILKIAKVNKV